MHLSVRTLLALPELRAADPELLAGAEGLDAPVRWVHVSEQAGASVLLQGGEFVLSTGQAFDGGAPLGADAVAAHLRGFREAGAAGIAFEILGDRPATAALLRGVADAAGLPVVLLRRRIRFVGVTETVHRMIVADQVRQLEASRRVHEAFTALSVENAGAQEIVAAAAGLAGRTVLFESPDGTVLHAGTGLHAGAGPHAGEGPRAGEGSGALAADWARRRAGTAAEDTLTAPVAGAGQDWGRLAAPGTPPDDDAAAMVLQRAAQALAIHHMAERDQREVARQAEAVLVNELRQPGTLTEEQALDRAAAMGFDAGVAYVPVVLALDAGRGGPLDAQRRGRLVMDALARVVSAARASALVARLHSDQVGLLLALPARQLEDPLLARVCAGLARTALDGGSTQSGTGQSGTAPGTPTSGTAPGTATSGSAPWWTVGVGRAQASLLDAALGLDEAGHVAQGAASLPAAERARRPYHRSADVRLRGLLAVLREDPRVRAFADSELAGLAPVELGLLERFLAAGGNKAALARGELVSRPALYARLDRLERRLGVPLDDAESRASLHVAVLVWRLGAR
ncbi:PucR family transcriptional regulator [Arthrobacter halodurans]|uniref:PucR family transcriptional regulator n=1 Tax=Arthrobacter halodurans TaxID=516699 RepID=A0ABV4UK51_9MICC